MFNIFKIKIPKNNAQEVAELESWTVSWKVRDRGYEYIQFSKVFIKENEAKEYQKQLTESAKFCKAYIETKMYKN